MRLPGKTHFPWQNKVEHLPIVWYHFTEKRLYEQDDRAAHARNGELFLPTYDSCCDGNDGARGSG